MNTTDTNPYSSLRQPGVRGSVNPERGHRGETITIVNRSDENIECWAAEIEDGAWDYGTVHVTVTGKDIRKSEKLPGEGSGWFARERDALQYGLYELRAKFGHRLSIRRSIDYQIGRLSRSTLF